MSRPEPIPFLDLISQHAELEGDLMRVFQEALRGAAFVGGPELQAFEEAFAEFCGVAHCVGVSSGTDALRLALMAAGLGQGQTVLTTPNTFIATTEAISQAGARFQFVDVDPATGLMDRARLEETLAASNGQIQGVVPVHLYGQCVDMEALGTLADQYGLTVVEDAAQAHGALHQGRRAGSLGLAAAFSFYPGKNLGACGEAGAVTTDDGDLAQRVRALRDHGQERKYHHLAEGYNARLDAIQAGVLRVKLARLEQWNQARGRVAAWYDQLLDGLEQARPLRTAAGNLHAHHLYVIRAQRRDDLLAHLGRQGIACGLHYPVPLHLQPCYSHLGFKAGDFPQAEALANEVLSLPMFPSLSQAQAQRVVGEIRRFYGV